MSHGEGRFDLRLVNGDATYRDRDNELFEMDNIEGTYADPRRPCSTWTNLDAIVPAALPTELHHFPVCICAGCRERFGPINVDFAVPLLREAVGEDWAHWCYQFAMKQRRVEKGYAWRERRESLDAVCRLAAPGADARRAVAALLVGAPWCDWP